MEFELRDNSGNIFCLNSNGILEGHENGKNCDDDYKRLNKNKFYARSFLHDSNIPLGMCILLSKNGNVSLEVTELSKEVRRSSDGNTRRENKKYFRAITVGNGKFKILNAKDQKYLRKDGRLIMATEAIDCENDCHFSLIDTIPSSTTQTAGFH